MSERKNIDRLFQEKLKDFDVAPPEHVWEHIEEKLKKKKKRRVIPFWFRLSGVAAALVLGILIANRYFSTDKNVQENEVVVQKNDSVPHLPNVPRTESDGIAIDDENVNDATKNSDLNAPEKSNSGGKPTSGSPIVNSDKYDRLKSAPNNTVAASGSQNEKTHTQQPNQKSQISEKEVHLKKPEKIAAANQPTNEQNNSIQRSQTSTGNNNNDALQNSAIAEGTGKNSENVAANQVKNENGGNSLTGIKSTNANAVNEALTNKTSEGVSAETAIAENTNTDKTDTTAVATVVPNALEKLLNEKEQEKKQLTTAEPKLNRWHITSSVAPIYFSSTSNGSPLDTRFEGNNKSYTPTVSYGAGVQYTLNKKFAIRSGVNSVAMEYNTNDVIFFQTSDARRIENVKTNVQGSMIQVDNTPTSMASTLGRTVKQYNGSLNQKTGYIEVPVEMTYKLIDKKFGVDVIGGFSTLFLNQNEVRIVGSGLEMNIGEANNLSDVHFSTNLGLGLKYKFLKSLEAHIEPTFKYQLNTYSNNSGNFKPYFLGLYTGLSYRF